MRFLTALRHQRREYFLQCLAVTTVICLLTAATLAQSTAAAQPAPLPFQDLKKYPGLLTEFAQLFKKIQAGVQVPAPRSQSRLLPLLPESTVFYAAFPNYGEASHQALSIFQQELKENAELRAWWEHVQSPKGQSSATEPKLEDVLEKFYQLSQFVGDEVVISAATEPHKDPSFLLLAEIRKPGLKDVLPQMARELAGKSTLPFRVLDVQELAAAKDKEVGKDSPGQLVILVRPDFVVGALNLASLRSFNARLDKDSQGLASTPFGHRMAQTYEGGATVVAGADLQTILKQNQPGTDETRKLLQSTGFGDVKYLVWEHKSVAGHSASQVELSFTGPRHGVASWLAAPGPLGSLDFVSPKAVMAGSIRLKNPEAILDDLTDLATISNPNALMQLAQMEDGLKLSLKKDLLSHLDGEITLESDSLVPTDPVWKAILKVNDPASLSATLTALLQATAKISPRLSEQDGVTYHVFEVPSGQKTSEIAYAFVDGYLIIGSGRETLAEAVRVHRSGESLAKSKTFLAAMPDDSSEVSALLYEDPVAVAAMTMRQVSPEFAELFSQSTAEPMASVVAGYGDESMIREASRSGSVDAGAVLVVAAIAIPNLLRSRIAANDSSAVASIRTVNTAQVIYSSSYPQKGYARDLASLGPDPRGVTTSSAEHASLIDATLGSATCTAGSWCTKSGYQFRISAICGFQRCQNYVVVATPVSSSTGTRNFCSTSNGVIRYKLGEPLTVPVTAAECRTWAPLQ